MKGHEARRLRHSVRRFHNRKNGLDTSGQNRSVTIGQAFLEGILMTVAKMSQLTLKDDTGVPWSPQNTDGSFPAQKGYDIPVN